MFMQSNEINYPNVYWFLLAVADGERFKLGEAGEAEEKLMRIFNLDLGFSR